ncbi:MAG: alanine--tRNA ligase [Firmicutes bacterium]|nr:alanine--tRNA ligase [Bacillota bacterium]MDY3770871.1 alanine--tRNA ligase [Lachnospiraceae bacterium]
MKQFTSNELRNGWLNFYKERGHVDVGAVSLVSDGSTGVMFNVAGMQPLMPYLLGKKHPLGTRLCNVQGCVRTNDIDSVGDTSHVTFFEMMGSWSLGDYFKEERTKWSFELLTQVYGFDRDHLAATVFAGDENAPRDEEGAQCRIASGFKKENVYYLPAEDNWWGLEYGPCGPDSEMFYIADVPDCGPNCGPGCNCGKYTELGNDVFMQYEKHKDGHLTPLKQKNVDTGWGLERNLAFLNGTKDVYKTDLFAPVIAYIEQVSGYKYEADETATRSMRIVADHIRTGVMLIGDEARLTPSNVGAGYVLRRLIRRAVRHGRSLGLKKEDLLKIASIYMDEIYHESYKNLVENREFVLKELDKEIVRFESTLENGMKEFKKILDETVKSGKQTISGKDAFYLYDTFGFPIELTVEMAKEENVEADEAGFEQAMEEQKQKARENQNFSAKLTVDNDLFKELDASVTSTFAGYDALTTESEIKVIATEDKLVDKLTQGQEGTVIVPVTTFYATMGGQKGDKGQIKTENGVFAVTDTVKLPGGRIGHIGSVVSGSIMAGEKASMEVDAASHANTCRNHSATHLLQAALQEVLGDQVHQQGSYQDSERTRFDFSYGQAVTKEELAKVEQIVNEKIAEDLQVTTQIMSVEEAKKTGAMALFGEKYGDEVRVVSMGDFSKELCGGTHVAHTGDIRAFKILAESGVAAGVRRIEAITGDHVIAYYAQLDKELAEIAALLKTTPAGITEKIEHLQKQVKELQGENESLKSKAAKEALGDVMDQVKEVSGVKLLATSVENVDMNGLRDLGDQLKEKIGEGVVVLASEKDGKVNLIAMATDAAMQKGAHAGNLIKGIAALVGGGGGGRPNMAQAGGKNPAGIGAAIAEAEKVLAGQIR